LQIRLKVGGASATVNVTDEAALVDDSPTVKTMLTGSLSKTSRSTAEVFKRSSNSRPALS
jgi:hypothetical protein